MRLVDVKAMSSLLNIKSKTIYDWVRKNQIPYYKVGRLVRFNRKEVQEWLARKHKEPEIAGEVRN